MWEARCVSSSRARKFGWVSAQPSKWEGNQILGAFEDAVFHLCIAFPAPHLLLSAVLGHVICHGPPISTLNAITTMKSMPSSARGGLASAIKLKFRFWLITGEECDREGNAHSLTHANGCTSHQPPARQCEGQTCWVALISECLWVYFTTLLRSGSYLIGSGFQGREKDNLVLSASLRSQYFMK